MKLQGRVGRRVFRFFRFFRLFQHKDTDTERLSYTATGSRQEVFAEAKQRMTIRSGYVPTHNCSCVIADLEIMPGMTVRVQRRRAGSTGTINTTPAIRADQLAILVSRRNKLEIAHTLLDNNMCHQHTL